ncbi:hypothetical protein [Variovorax paradoxus]|uniref:hypothetical protein n=1 Tax=Variovorax paradoxus TaxID=34073 RepID=UPI002781A79C|nr:hypothetical protein [Variovorax paradoxus]MDQ0586630.1 hypothetical protein [Variovorax paradoxus]
MKLSPALSRPSSVAGSPAIRASRSTSEESPGFHRPPSVADIDASQYVGIEIEALVVVPSRVGVGEALKVFTSADEDPVATYSVFLRSGPDASKRIGDFATCLEAVEYAESAMAYQMAQGVHWTRGGKIFDLYCVSGHPDDLRFLGRESKNDSLQWVSDPAEAMVFNRCAGHGKCPETFLPDDGFRKHPWLAAQVRFARHRKMEETSATAVFIKTMPTHRFGASFAEVQVDQGFTLRLLRLQRLCISKRLSEVRVDAAPRRWGPGDVRADLALSHDQLIVTQATFRFAARSAGACASVETCPQNIVAFLRTVRAHRPESGTLVVEEDDCGGLAKGTGWKDWPA